MRIDRYWKQAAAGLLAIMTLTMTGGNLDSLAMTNSQPLKAQGQMLSSPDKIIIRDEGETAQSSQACLLYTSRINGPPSGIMCWNSGS